MTGVRCKDVFQHFIIKGESVEYGKTVVKNYNPVQNYQTEAQFPAQVGQTLQKLYM
jgi:hypothetical protein